MLSLFLFGASQVELVVKNLSVSAGDVRDGGSVPGLERYPGGEHGNPFQYSCLENPRDRGTWWAAVYGIAQSRTQLKRLSSSSLHYLIKQKDHFSKHGLRRL